MATKTSYNSTSVKLIPFTSGIIPFVYAFFWPASFGNWLGVIVHAFRAASGI